MSVYRQNPVLPPRGTRESLIAYAAIEAACRDELYDTLLAEHLLDLASSTAAIQAVRERADAILARLALPHAPIGSGRRYARDRGGRVARAVDAWANSFEQCMRGAVDTAARVPHDRTARRVWDIAHPAWAKAVEALQRLYPDSDDAAVELARAALDWALGRAELVEPAAEETPVEATE